MTAGAISVRPSAAADRTIDIDASAPTQPFPHFWEKMMGSGRAALTMRAAWRRDLHDVQAVTELRYVRFHAILSDELGVYDENANGQPKYNFQYVDQIYDGLLAAGVKPIVELSFMPRKLALRPDVYPFLYKPYVSPPKDNARWDALITTLARHLLERYGIAEVSSWYFEVWNEPNIGFWTGIPAQSSYFEFYDHTARALKAVDSRLRVGGPATSSIDWIEAFIGFTAKFHVPLDFLSTHVYGDDVVDRLAGHGRGVPPYGTVCPAMRKVREEVSRSPRPDLPIFFTETSLSFIYENPLIQGRAVATWLAETVGQCAGVVDAMALWALSDVFEEQGVIARPFSGGFGVIAQGGIPKPVHGALALLHRLGGRRIAVASPETIATVREDGSVAALIWNRSLPGTPPKTVSVEVRIRSSMPPLAANLTRLDQQHGDTLHLYQAMGSPTYPTPRQVSRLREAILGNGPETQVLADGVARLQLPPDGMALLEVAMPTRAAGSPRPQVVP